MQCSETFFILILLMVMPCVAKPGDTPPGRKIEAVKSHIVKIIVTKPDADDTENGAGIVVSRQNPEGTCWIITAYHVVKDAETINVVFYDEQGTRWPAEMFERYDKDKDFAIISVKRSTGRNSRKRLEFANDKSVKEMDAIHAVGHPLNKDWYCSSGEIRKSDDILFFAFSKETIDPANSGGGLFDAHYHLIGMVTHKSLNDGRALKIERAMEMLVKWKIPYNLTMHSEMEKWLIISGGCAVIAGGGILISGIETNKNPERADKLPDPPDPGVH